MDEHHYLAWIGNVASVGAVLGALTGLLPAVGAVIAIIWYAIQIKESVTFNQFRRRRRQRKIARLHAELQLLSELQKQDKDAAPPSDG